MNSAYPAIRRRDRLASWCAACVATLAVASGGVLLLADDNAAGSPQAIAAASIQVAMNMSATSRLPAQAGQPQAY